MAKDGQVFARRVVEAPLSVDCDSSEEGELGMSKRRCVCVVRTVVRGESM